MIVAKTDKGQILVGIAKTDLDDLKAGLTKTKQGNPQYGFKSLIVFMGETDQAMIDMLNTQGAVRHDDFFRNSGQG